MGPRLHENARDHACREHGRACNDGAAVFWQNFGGNHRHAGGAHRAHKTRHQTERRDAQARGVAAGGDQKRAAKGQANTDNLAHARFAAIGDAGISHDDDQLQALKDRRGSGVGQAHGRKIAKLVEQQAKGGKEQQLLAVGRRRPKLNQACAVARDNHSHKEQAGENLSYAHKPQRIDMVGIEQKTRAGAREAPKRAAHERSQHAHDHLARLGVVEAVAPCTAGAAAELIGALGHINVRYIGHRHRSPCAFDLLDTLFAHPAPPKQSGNNSAYLTTAKAPAGGLSAYR